MSDKANGLRSAPPKGAGLADSLPPESGQSSVPIHVIKRCPKCGAITERMGHCFVKGPPLIPQMDSDTTTERCEVIERAPFVAALALLRGGALTDEAYYEVLRLITPEDS